ncbi:leucine-rich repeat-containing protein 49 [Apis mellifera caucasica]|nr:leucine-rich repeat-containing protein 49 [Apis mellifera caucasica]KAG9433704.1 leucine-rich repeat-containing protein 49 [Apis mellifera carnica]
MPVSNNRITRTKTIDFDIKGIKGEAIKTHTKYQQNNNFLTIVPALPILPGALVPSKLFKRRYNSFSPTDSPFNIEYDKVNGSNSVNLQWTSEGKTVMATRTASEKEKNPDRICLDRRGLTSFPNIIGEPRLRLLSLQHNLLTKIENCNFLQLTKLVFLDLYDNQIERICNFEILENLRVLLIGKNRIKRIEGLNHLSKLEVLDLHGNQIVQISDLNNLISLKVLNLAGNNIKIIGHNDFQGLTSLKELNLRRNKIKKLLGFDETRQLQKLYLSNNDIHKIEDIGNLAKALQLREITIDGNPITLNGDYVSFLVSYLPNLQSLSTMQITEQIRRTAVAWRTAKEQNNSTFLNLSAQLSTNSKQNLTKISQNIKIHDQHGLNDYQLKSSIDSSGYGSLSSKTNSIDSCKSVLSDCSTSSISKNINIEKSKNKDKRTAQAKKVVCYKNNKVAIARAKKKIETPPTPLQNLSKEREQGGDYLIEIVGRCLNIYGQGALRFIDRLWDSSKAEDVNIVKFNYVQFNDVAKVLYKIKNRFPNLEHFMFKETNISYLGQLNALAEVQGLTSIHIETGNPIISKNWKVYAIFRLAHWGLKVINGREITNEEIDLANKEYAGLIDIVMCSLPEYLLQPLLQRLHLDKVQKQIGEITAKQFLLNSDPALRNVVAKEALQWRKGSITQEDLIWRHKGKKYLLNLINLTVDAIQKLQLLENKWPSILYEIIHTTLFDFSEMDAYMKRCSKTLQYDK